MFEDCLLESGGRDRTKKSLNVLISTAVHGALLIALILVPLIYTEALPSQQLMTFLIVPPPPAPVPPPPPDEIAAEPVIRTEVQIDPGAMVAPTEIPEEIAVVVDEGPPPAVRSGAGPTDRSVIAGLIENLLPAPVEAEPPPPPPPALPPPQQDPIRVSAGVQQGNIVDQVQPVYPPLASQARVSGVVVLEAVIARDGTIQNLRVVSGHPLLIDAARDAVRQWRYRPYMLNGEPVEVVTTITMQFSLN